MKWCFILLMFCLSKSLQAQYYYNDIVTTNQSNKQFQLLSKNNIRGVAAFSYEADGTTTENFALNQVIDPVKHTITTTSEYPSAGTSITTAWYSNNQIIKSTDSSNNISSTITYNYNADNKISSITTDSRDAFMNNSSSEQHVWQYDNGIPVRMFLIKNNIDTTTVQFLSDESGDVTEERWYKNGKRVETYYYYYNPSHQLTDVVRFNLRAQKLLPDFTFEYNAEGAITQYIQVPQGSDNYLVWHYVYLSNGLKEKEICTDKNQQMIGRIEYAYKQ